MRSRPLTPRSIRNVCGWRRRKGPLPLLGSSYAAKSRQPDSRDRLQLLVDIAHRVLPSHDARPSRANFRYIALTQQEWFLSTSSTRAVNGCVKPQERWRRERNRCTPAPPGTTVVERPVRAVYSRPINAPKRRSPSQQGSPSGSAISSGHVSYSLNRYRYIYCACSPRHSMAGFSPAGHLSNPVRRARRPRTVSQIAMRTMAAPIPMKNGTQAIPPLALW